MRIGPAFFEWLAAGLLERQPQLARRYLHLRRRAEILHNHQRLAVRNMRNPLWACGVRPPISVADSPPEVRRIGVVLAEARVPVSVNRDSKGRHIGTPLSDVLDTLRRSGIDADERQVLRWAHRASDSWNRLRRHQEKVRRQLEVAETALKAAQLATDPSPTLQSAYQACVALGTSRFMVTLDRSELDGVLQDMDSPSVVLGYSPASGFRVAEPGISPDRLSALFGHGSGYAVVRREHLCQEVVRGVSGAVVIECLPECWRFWRDASDLMSRPTVFEYE